MTQGSVASWNADHLRVSLFGEEIWSVSVEDVFNGAFNVAPDSVTSRPAAGEASASGFWNGNKLEVKKAFREALINSVAVFDRGDSSPCTGHFGWHFDRNEHFLFVSADLDGFLAHVSRYDNSFFLNM